jgi:hypothetical protein
MTASALSRRGSTGRRSGTAMHFMPAAVAASTPLTESSRATQLAGATPIRAAVVR